VSVQDLDRQNLIHWLCHHPNPERLIVRKAQNRLKRPACLHQFFTDGEQVENFALLMEDRGIATEIRKCSTCERVYAVIVA